MKRRVTVESFIDAVKKTGVVPRRCLWIRKGTDTIEACAIGALAVQAGETGDARRWARSADGLGLTHDYVMGFIGGFDGCGGRHSAAEQYEIGREDGLACATAAFDEKLHEQYRAADVDLTPYLTPPSQGGEEQYIYTEMS